MRTRRAAVIAITAVAALMLPTAASADGGAYIDFRGGTGSGAGGTHFLPGDGAGGTAYVSIPRSRQVLLERGPFSAYLVTGRHWIQEGRPLPPGTIRLGTVTILPDRASDTTFEIRMSFAVPDVPGGYYTVQICNDPCTISGFRETLSGTISIVATEREAELLNEQDRLQRRAWSLQRRARKAEKAAAELESQLGASRQQALELSAEVSRLERELVGGTAAPVVSVADDRPLVDAWALVAIAIALIVAALAFALALALAGRSDGPRILVPDTIEELEREEASAPTA